MYGMFGPPAPVGQELEALTRHVEKAAAALQQEAGGDGGSSPGFLAVRKPPFLCCGLHWVHREPPCSLNLQPQ